MSNILTVLTAISVSNLHQTTHNNFIGLSSEVLKDTVDICLGAGYIIPVGEHFYSVTDLGNQYIQSLTNDKIKSADKAVDEFISKL